MWNYLEIGFSLDRIILKLDSHSDLDQHTRILPYTIVQGGVMMIVLALVGIVGLLYLVRNTASRYLVVDDRRKMERMYAAEAFSPCAACGLLSLSRCSGCKMVKYCSRVCQVSHWKSEHKTKCKELQSIHEAKPKSTPSDDGSKMAPHLLSVEENVERFRRYTRDPKDSRGKFLEHYVTLWRKASEGGVSDIEASTRLVRLLPLRWQSWATREMASTVTRDSVTYAEVGDFLRFLSIVSAGWTTAGKPPSRDVGVDPASLVVGPTI